MARDSSQFRSGYLAYDQNLPWSKFFPQLKVTVTSMKMLCLFLKTSAVFFQGFFVSIYQFHSKSDIIVSLTAVEAVPEKKLYISTAKTNPSPATKNLPHNLLRMFSNRNILPQTIKTKLISSHHQIWLKIVLHSNTDVFTQLKLFINYLKEKNTNLPPLQNQHGACFRTEEEKQKCSFFLLRF